MSTNPVESERKATATELAIGEVMKAPIVVAIKTEKSIVIEENTENPIVIEENIQKQIVIEENTKKPIVIENDLDDLIIIENDPVEPILIEDDTSESSDDFSRKKNSDGNLLHRIKSMDEKDIEIEFKTDHGRILFEKYFKMALKNENNMTTSCQLCNSVLKCNTSCYDLLLHFKVCKMDLYVLVPKI